MLNIHVFHLFYSWWLQVRTLFVSGLPMDAKPRELYLLFRAYEGYEGSLLKVTSKNGKTASVSLFLRYKYFIFYARIFINHCICFVIYFLQIHIYHSPSDLWHSTHEQALKQLSKIYRWAKLKDNHQNTSKILLEIETRILSTFIYDEFNLDKHREKKIISLIFLLLYLTVPWSAL